MDQFYHGRLPSPNDHRVFQAQAPHLLGNNCLSSPASPGTGSNLGIPHHGLEECEYTTHLGFTSLCLTPSATPGRSHSLMTDPHGNESGCQQTYNIVPGISQHAADPNEVTPRTTTTSEDGGYTDNRVAGHRTRGDGRSNPTPNDPHVGQHSSNESIHLHQFQTGHNWNHPHAHAHGTLTLLDDHASSLDHGLDHNWMVVGYCTQAPYMPRHNNLVHGLSTAAYQSPPLRGSNGETTGALWFTGRLSTRGLGSRTVGGRGDLTEPPVREGGRISESGGQLDPTTLLPVVLPVAPSSIQYKAIQQTLYECPTQQDRWIRQPPIEFGLVKLTDAAGLGYIGLPGYNDKVLDYEGVGSSISCRLNFSGRELGRCKILTTDNKKTPEPITKKKLASEMAKFVKRHIGEIMVQEGCSDVTVESVALGKLYHVSRASWQPELWHEVATPGHNSS